MKNTFRKLALTLVLCGLAVLTPQPVQADGHEFHVSVYHGINGKSLGLSKALPVEATIERNGEVLTTLPLSFGDRVETMLPAGTYKITVYSVELEAQLDTMTVGPVDLPSGVDVDLHAKLSGNKTPVIKAKVK